MMSVDSYEGESGEFEDGVEGEEEDCHPIHDQLPLPTYNYHDLNQVVLIEDQKQRLSELLNAETQAEEFACFSFVTPFTCF